jgi:hypothetical protein
VGLAASQTAQLSVVNLTPATTANSTMPFVPCQVQLEFWDTQGNLVKSGFTGNLASGATFSLQLKLTEVTTNTSPLRTQIRGVVRQSRALVTPADPGEQAPAIPTFVPLSCAVATTLEVFDTTSGVTQALTSDLHAMSEFNIVPLRMASMR